MVDAAARSDVPRLSRSSAMADAGWSRRDWLAGSLGAGLVGAPAASGAGEAPAARAGEPFGYCLNTATLQGQKLSLVEQVEVAARAGYQGIEPWVRDLEA